MCTSIGYPMSGSHPIADKEYAKNVKLEDAINSGRVSTKVDKKKQAPHKKGSDAYNKRLSEGDFPSYTELSNMEVQNIINKYKLTGKVHIGADGQFREVITADSVIGMFGDRDTRTYKPTRRATIHYSKSGTHLVPASPEVE